MTAAKTYANATPARKQRICEQVAPLVVQGQSSRQIAKALGIAPETARVDMQLCKEMWLTAHSDSRDEWQGRLLAQYEWMLKELAEAWQSSKHSRITRVINPDGTEMIRQEPPDPRWLSGMLAVAKEASTFLGIREGADTVSRVEIPEATRSALAPMSTDTYMAMLASTGGLSAVNAVPPIDRRSSEAVEPVAVECLPQQAETPPEPEAGSELPKRQPRFIRRGRI